MQGQAEDQPQSAFPDGAARYVADELPKLLEVLQHSDVRELEVEEGDVQVRLRRDPAEEFAYPSGEDLVTAESAPLEPAPATIRAPLVGTFFRAAAPGSPPLVTEGSSVEDGAVVGIIEALHVPTEVEAGCSGRISRVLAEDGQAVEYGQPLFEVEARG